LAGKSGIKRSKQAQKSRLRNASVRSAVKTSIKSVLEAVSNKGQEASLASLKKAVPLLAKAGAKGVFPKKTVSRKISRITKKVNSLLA